MDIATLEQMTLAELEAIAAKLQAQIARNPKHSKMEKVELEDVNGWIALRKKEADTNSSPLFSS